MYLQWNLHIVDTLEPTHLFFVDRLSYQTSAHDQPLNIY